jgi:uncharacterized Tic20 family protein
MSRVILADYGPEAFPFFIGLTLGIFLCLCLVVAGATMLFTAKEKSQKLDATLFIAGCVLAFFVAPLVILLLNKLWKWL